VDVTCTVPRLIGKTLRSSRLAISAAGCGLGKVSRVASRRRAGLVVAQSPKAGVRLVEGRRIALAVSRRPKRR